MDFTGAEANEERIKDSVIGSVFAVALSVSVLLLVVLLPVGKSDGALLALSGGMVAIASALVAAFVLSPRTRPLGKLDSWTVVAISGLCVGVAFLSGVADPSMKPLLRGFVLLAVLFVGSLNNSRTRFVTPLAALVVLIYQGNDLDGGDMARLALIGGFSLLICQYMMRRSVAGYLQVARTNRSLKGLMEAVAPAKSVEEGIKMALPTIPSFFPASRAVAMVKTSDNEAFSVLSSWPKADPMDSQLIVAPGFTEALVSNQTTVEGTFCFLPVGHTEIGELVVILEVPPSVVSSGQFLKESGESIAATLLRLTGRAAYGEDLRRKSRVDGLTGLANRRVLIEQIGVEMVSTSGSEAEGPPLAVVMWDIDGMAGFNDEFGRESGDDFLRQVSQKIMGRLRSDDLLARFGGEEFCALLPHTDEIGATAVAAEVREIVKGASSPAFLGATAGVAVWDGAESEEDLLIRAEDALYRAKDKARNSTEIASLEKIRTSTFQDGETRSP